MKGIKSRLLGYLAFLISICIKKTLRVKWVAHSLYNSKEPYLFCFWHGKQFLPVLELINHQTLRAVLVSPSKDGEILSTWLKQLNYKVIRGSSRNKNIASLKKMISFLKNGYSLGFGIDGPVGPIYKVKPGMTFMAQRLNIKIIPVGTYFEKKWVFNKAWDKYEIPKPFSKAVIYIGKPIKILPQQNLDEANLFLEQKIQEAEAIAFNACS
ncbi:MAG: hypothetical protein JWM09_538 [Francisellaceae bacterium]|nr:hypothetical protein [Francisellaceae bacterium]